VHVPGRVAMVDFFSPTCASCVTMEPVVDSLATMFAAIALVGKVNAAQDDTLDVAYLVNYLPTFVFLKNGAEYKRIIGITPKDTLVAYIRRGLEDGMGKRRDRY